MRRHPWTTRFARARLQASARHLVTLGAVSGFILASASLAQAAGKLSDAAKETVKPPAEQRPVAAREPVPASVVVIVAVPVTAPAPCPAPYPEPYHEPYYAEPYLGHPGPPGRSILDDLHVGAVITLGTLSSPDFGPSRLYGLRVGARASRRTSVDLVLLGGSAAFAGGSDIAHAFRDPREIGLEASVRYALRPGYGGLGIAPVAGFRVGMLSWRYLNGIQIASNGSLHTITDDTIKHYSPYLGLALTPLRSRHLDLGVTALRAWRFYAGESGERLTNDLFLDDRYHELRLESTFVF